MGFLAPFNLWALLALPILVWLYWRSSQRPAQSHIRYPDAATLALALPRPGLLSYLPAGLFGLALLIAMLGAARPTLKLLVPQNMAGVVLAIENGYSMRNTDIAPSRIEATKKAARDLIAAFPKTVPVGLATFSNFGTLNIPLTTDRPKLLQALDLMDLGDGYSFTYGILAALEALPEKPPAGVNPGAIVLYSHGHDVSGNDPLEIAAKAAKRGIKIHTVGVGTHGNNFNEDILKVVAEQTGGRYYPIFSAADLQNVHRDLGQVIGYQRKPTEVSALATLLAGVLLICSLLLGEMRRKVV